MNSNYNYSDFSGVHLTTNNDSQQYDNQLELQLAHTQAVDTPEEKHIKAMLLTQRKFHIYNE